MNKLNNPTYKRLANGWIEITQNFNGFFHKSQFYPLKSNVTQESTRICPGEKVERDFVDDVNGLRTTCKSCRGTWDAFDGMFADAKWDEIEGLNPAE